MAPKFWKKNILSKHYKSVEKAKFKAKSKAEHSYLKHLEKVSQSERVIVETIEPLENFNSISDMVIDENVEVDDKKDLVICEEDDDEDQEVHEANGNLTIKDVQAAHPYAVPAPYHFEEKEELKNIDFDSDDMFAEEFTPVQPMLEDYLPEDDQKDMTDFWTWFKRVKKQEWKNVQKKTIPWKNWKTKDYEQWFAQALVYQNRVEEPKSTPIFIKNLQNTEHKRFMFNEMESSQNRRRCWKSLNFD